MEQRLSNWLSRYGIAILIVVLATTVRLLFAPWISARVPFLTYYLAVLVTAWFGGLGPGLLAAGLCTVLANYLFMSPQYQLVPDLHTFFTLMVFVLEAGAIAMISDQWKVTNAALRQREAELQDSLEALRTSQEAFRTISDAAPAMVWVCDQNGQNIFVNDSWCKYTGQSHEQAAGLGWTEMIHPEDRASTLLFRQPCEATDDSYEGECRYRSKEGRYQWHAFRALPRLAADGRVEAWYGVSVDITARKQAEEQLQRWTSELEQGVASRTEALVQSQEQLRALASELTLTEQRARMQLAAELHDHLAQLLVVGRLKLRQVRQGVGANQRTTDLLNDIDETLSGSLTYTRTLVAELTPPVLHQFGLPAALHWLSDHMRRHDLTVTVDVDAAQDLTLPEDRAILLFQSARELLINVAKHAGAPSATLRLTRAHDELRLEVCDTGLGFNTSEAADSSSRQTSKFGLFSIGERMKALGGSFEIESAIGRGTRASLVLPVTTSRPDGEESEQKGPVAMPVAMSSGPQLPPSYCEKAGVSRVLLVDDHAMVRQGLRSVLDHYPDVQVVGEASNGQEALEAMDSARPSVVVMDINMPTMNGIDATRRIKARYPHVVVIGVSVNLDGNSQLLMKQAGADLFLSKEAAVEQLHSAIRGTIKDEITV